MVCVYLSITENISNYWNRIDFVKWSDNFKSNIHSIEIIQSNYMYRYMNLFGSWAILTLIRYILDTKQNYDMTAITRKLIGIVYSEKKIVWLGIILSYLEIIISNREWSYIHVCMYAVVQRVVLLISRSYQIHKYCDIIQFVQRFVMRKDRYQHLKTNSYSDNIYYNAIKVWDKLKR